MHPKGFESFQINRAHIEASVESEYGENDRRLNWFLLFQAFLFQGYATALQAVTGANNASAKDEVLHARSLLVIIIVVGLLTSVLTVLSTQAGIWAICKLKYKRTKLFKETSKTYGVITDGWFPLTSPLHTIGLLPTMFGPAIILVAWIVLMAHAMDASILNVLNVLNVIQALTK